jgi:hypothetical protein
MDTSIRMKGLLELFELEKARNLMQLERIVSQNENDQVFQSRSTRGVFPGRLLWNTLAADMWRNFQIL